MHVYVITCRITEHLGSGEFGTVCKGFWHTNHGSLEVAIKMVQNQVLTYRDSYTRMHVIHVYTAVYTQSAVCM